MTPQRRGKKGRNENACHAGKLSLFRSVRMKLPLKFFRHSYRSNQKKILKKQNPPPRRKIHRQRGGFQSLTVVRRKNRPAQRLNFSSRYFLRISSSLKRISFQPGTASEKTFLTSSSLISALTSGMYLSSSAT